MKFFIALALSAISSAPTSRAIAPMPAAISPARPFAAPAPPKMPLTTPNAAPATHVVPDNFPIAPFEIQDDLDSDPAFLESASVESFDMVPMPDDDFKPIEKILQENRDKQASQQSLQAAAIMPIWTGGPNSDSGSLLDDIYAETEEADEEEYAEEEEEENEEEDYDEDYDEESSDLLQGVGFYKDGQLYPF